MKTVFFAILASTACWSLASGWTPSSSCSCFTEMRLLTPSYPAPKTVSYIGSTSTPRSRTTTRRTSWRLYGAGGTKDPSSAAAASSSPADVLLRMVDEIAKNTSSGSGSADQLEKMEQLERALSLFVQDEKKDKQEPRPPTIPPPLASLLGINTDKNNVLAADDDDDEDNDNDEALAKAEQALQKLRQRLKEEEESLRQAEQALARSREEDETLRKAELALQRSREEAEKRKAQAIRQTEQAVASAKKTRQEKQTAEQEMAQDISASYKSSSNNNKPRATIAIQKPQATSMSLLDSLYGKKDEEDENESVNGGDPAINEYGEPPQIINQAPQGVPILYDWVQYIDGSISGKVKGSKSFKDGSSVSTSAIQVRAVFGSVVMTASGNKYFLERPPSKEGDKATAAAVEQEEAPQQVKEQERAAAEEASKVKEQEKKETAAAAELKAKEEQARGQQERKAAAEQKYKDAAEAKREAAKMAREIRRKEEEAEKAKKAEAAAAQAAAVKEARNGKTEPKAESKPLKLAKAPNGVPSIMSWKERDDGGISGQIFGSPNADDGDYIETSPIEEGIAENGYVVETVSGSRYFLSPDKAAKTNNVFNAFKDMTMARPGGTITISKEKIKEKNADKRVEKALETLAKGSPRSTFSLLDLGLGFGGANLGSFFGGGINSKAPKGVPTLLKWSTNKDGTITGIITGSPSLDDGEFITTSPIARGEKKRGKTVTTKSGSKYFLG